MLGHVFDARLDIRIHTQWWGFCHAPELAPVTVRRLYAKRSKKDKKKRRTIADS